jgi:hypothetical protein
MLESPMAEDVRDLGFVSWKNEMAWMEKQKGTQWTTIINHESELFTRSLNGLDVNDFKRDLVSETQKHHPWEWRGWTIKRSGFSNDQIWKRGSFKKRCWSADISKDGKWFAATVQNSEGFERFSVELYSIGSKIVLVKTISKSGPDIAFYNNVLIHLGSSKDLRYDSVISYNPENESTTIIYRLDEPTENLELGRGEDGCVYVLSTDFVNKRFGLVSDTDISWKIHEVKDIFVVNYNYWIINQVSPFSDEVLESISMKGGWAVTRSYGIRTLWNTSTPKPSVMITVWGEINFDSRDPTRLLVTDIRYEPYVVYTNTWKLSNPRPYPFPIVQYRYPAPSFVVYPDANQEVKALLITAYSAYGIPTRIGNLVDRWKPLLMRGWAIATVCLPGSGDHDIEWKESGQRENRKIAIDTLRDAVLSLQEELNIPARATCLYGRSAGGLIVISTATLYKQLVGALYVESPYVDVLRTISNKKLPLTDLETREFGIGTDSLNIMATQAWSPMEHIPAEGFPGLFVVARSDTEDLEVFPYEVVKWIQRIRGINISKDGQKKLLYVDHNKGHFTTSAQSRAEDLALLDNWVNSPDGIREKKSAPRTKNRSTKYKMAATRKNRKNMTRKNRKNMTRKDRKNRNNAAVAPMMGGKRRKSRKSRKGRKGSRRH